MKTVLDHCGQLSSAQLIPSQPAAAAAMVPAHSSISSCTQAFDARESFVLSPFDGLQLATASDFVLSSSSGCSSSICVSLSGSSSKSGNGRILAIAHTCSIYRCQAPASAFELGRRHADQKSIPGLFINLSSGCQHELPSAHMCPCNSWAMLLAMLSDGSAAGLCGAPGSVEPS